MQMDSQWGCRFDMSSISHNGAPPFVSSFNSALKGLEPKFIPQLFLGLLLRTRP